ncbi:MAG: hypothetical protein SFX73_20045 [Kofleriaceae bacterium]|nr:hypothetical protein [Kofleriaceae bacterium]
MRRALALVLGLLSSASPAGAAPVLAALAPSPGGDAREALAIGPAGEVYRPDGKGAWVRALPVSTAGEIVDVGTAGEAVVALANGTVYRLAANGWSALRLVQKGKAVMSSGSRAVAAVGRQLFALDRTVNGEPAKLALAPATVQAIGGGAVMVIATERGLYRYDGRGFKQVTRGPRRVDRLVGDRWALHEGGLLDVSTGTRARLPDGVTLSVASVGPDGPVAVGSGPDGLVLVTVKGKKVDTVPLPGSLRGAVVVGVVADKAGRATVALRNGRLAIRDGGTWLEATARDALPGPRPGAPPARLP